MRSILLIAFGAVGLVLLIACLNVINLQLSRSTTREKEIALRTALGATRGRVIRQLLTESILLALLGGVLGVALAYYGVHFLQTFDPISTDRQTLTIDYSVLFYSAFISILTGVSFGLAAAWKTSTANLTESLKEGTRGSSSGDRGGTVRNFLTVAQIALAAVLLISAGLLTRSFIKLIQIDPGFVPKDVLALQFNLPAYSYGNNLKKISFYSQVLQNCQAIPGVLAAGAINDLPLTSDVDSDTFSIEGQTKDLDPAKLPGAQDRLVTPEYFKAMRIPLISGREFVPSDSASAAPVALINEALASRFFPHQNPVGQRVKFGPYDAARPWITIVGVVGSIRDFSLASEPDIEIFTPYQQNSLPYEALSSMTLVVRLAPGQKVSEQALTRAVRGVDRFIPLPAIQTMEEVFATSIAERRSSMMLLAVFAMVALLLAAIGVYGVVSYSVARRTAEIGIRMAVGARANQITGLIVGHGLRLTAAGLLIGFVGAIAVSRLLRSMLFQTSTWDAATFGGIGLLVLCLATLASYIPARRATRVDPLRALRHE